MQWLEVKVTFAARDVDLSSELIADIFYELGAKGVVIDDPVQDALQDWGDDAVPPPESPAVTAYLPADDTLSRSCTILTQRLDRLALEQEIAFDTAYRNVDEEDWAESWKAFFHPQKISDRLVVTPTWRPYTPREGEHIITIDPGMAFGTGTHPTTRLCLRLLERHLRPGQSVLDVGTGSGILLIAADRLGAGRLTGVDSDPMAVTVARRNLILNGLKPERFDLYCGHLTENLSGAFSVVVANILADVILDLLDQIERVLAPGGLLICSGIIASRRDEILARLKGLAFAAIAAEVEDEWVAVTARSPEDARRI